MKRCGTRYWRRADARASAAASDRAQRRARALRALALIAPLAAAGGCVSKGMYDEVVGERDSLAKLRRDLEARVAQLESANQGLSAERIALIDENEDLRISADHNEREATRLARVEAELARSLATNEAELAARTAEIEAMRNSYDGLVSDLESEVAAGQIQIEQLRSGLKLNLSEEVLFPSGSASLNAGGEAVLRKVSGRLRELEHSIQIEGHTDNVPVARRYASNWELAAARASSVARLLIDLGVAPERIKVVSRAEFAPIASNDTAKGRAQNRRIEILLGASADAAGLGPREGAPASATGVAPGTAAPATAPETEGAPAS